MTIREAFSDFLADCVDLKYQLVAISTVLFYLDKLSEIGWMTTVLSLCGVRLLDNVGTLVKDKVLAGKDYFKEADKVLPTKTAVQELRDKYEERKVSVRRKK